MEDLIYPLLRRYVAAPQWVKTTVGGVYSALPRSWRYGRAYGRFRGRIAHVDASHATEMTEYRLRQALQWAIGTVPAYRPYADLLSTRAPVAELLAQLPLTSKQDIKADPARYCSTAMPEGRRLPMFTGGSTAEPMQFFLERNASRAKEYAFMAAFHQHVGLDDKSLVLALRGRSVPGAATSGTLWMYEPIKRQLILSSDHLDERYMPAHIDVLRRWRPRHVQAFPSALYPLARWLRDHPAPEVTEAVRGVLLYSENVYDYQIRLLRQVFACPVLCHYGHSERVLMATSMPDDDRYFFWPHYGYLELLDPAGRRVTTPGETGEIVGTAYDNRVMPFVRYRTGDIAVLGGSAHPDLPGYPVCERIEGRLQEFVACSDRRLVSVTTLGAAHFEELATVSAIQYEQHEAGHLILNVVAASALDSAAVRRIEAAVRDKTQGGCEVRVRRVDAIPRTARGKHRMLVQRLDLSGHFGASAGD